MQINLKVKKSAYRAKQWKRKADLYAHYATGFRDSGDRERAEQSQARADEYKRRSEAADPKVG